MSPRRASRERECGPTDAHARLTDARAFLEAGRAFVDESTDVAASNAVLAGIAAADALCCLTIGRRSAGAAHHDAVALVDRVDRDGAHHLWRLGLKNKAEYATTDVSASHARLDTPTTRYGCGGAPRELTACRRSERGAGSMSYRVIQWATGNQGVEAIRAILDTPGLELVGARVYGEDKEGVDVGTLVGREPVGVTATRDTDAILGLDADCVVYLPRHTSLDEVCSILASGKDRRLPPPAAFRHPKQLGTAPTVRRRHVGARLRPESRQPQWRAPARAVGDVATDRQGDAPGARRLVLLREHPHHLRQQWRFGRPPEHVTEEASDFLRFNSGIFKEEVRLLGDALGADLDEVTAHVELVTAREDHDIFGITLEAGTVGGQRWHRPRLDPRRRDAHRDRDAAAPCRGGAPPTSPDPRRGGRSPSRASRRCARTSSRS
ncbi:MAG: hypothetical protein U5R31_00810 [Acidimicrobiia bacterium]|nr:hypothetical protein [Acidimicrobiia bacterium]